VVAGVGPSIYLSGAQVDCGINGTHPFSWNAAFDNTWNINPITSVDPALGLDIAIDGSSPDISVLEDGIWAYTFQIVLQPATDATVAGFFGSQFVGLTSGAFNGLISGGLGLSVSEVITLPAGAFARFRAFTLVDATGANYNITPYLSIVRLARAAS
jgi:hypothetical protein